MSKKKSLGSSPLGYSTVETSSFRFIPDLEVSENDSCSSKQQDMGSVHNGMNKNDSRAKTNAGETRYNPAHQNKTPEKKITSYYLEVGLVERLKIMADDNGTYYSTLVNEAIQNWLEVHDY